MAELRLKQVGRFMTEWMYFYEGQAPVKDGVITLPLTPAHLPWAQRAFLKGFRENPDTGEPVSMDDIINTYAALSAESSGDDTDVAETVDGADSGGQPPDSDGLRESEPQGGASVPEEGVEGPVSDGPAKPTPRKRTRRRTTRSKPRG